MNVVFDIFVLAPSLVKETTVDEDIFYKELLHFIAQRLNPLKLEIDKEEETLSDAVTIIHILRKDNRFISFNGYSKDLREKMLHSFTKEDITYLISKIKQIIDAKNN